MSFRGRLTLFFVLIVLVPMLSVAIVLFRLIADNEQGKADAELAARQRTAQALYDGSIERAQQATKRIGGDRALATALRANDRPAAERRVAALVDPLRLDRIVITSASSPTRTLADVGDVRAVAPAVRRLLERGGRSFGRLEVSVRTAPEYAELVREATGLDVVVRSGARTLTSTTTGRAPALPPPGDPQDLTVAGSDVRAVSFDAPGFRGRSVRVGVLAPAAQRAQATSRARLLAGFILAGFFFLAVTFAVAVSRTLQAQIGAFLAAARRLGSGDFTTQVPTTGRDEFAALGEEFNAMATQLSGRLDDLSRERERLENALRRIGDTLASNLDRDALLEIVVATCVDGVGAQGGRAQVAEGGERMTERARAGTFDVIDEALGAAERTAFRTREPADGDGRGAHALAHPLLDAEGTVRGTVSVARVGDAFTTGERELFRYLAGRAGVSIGNVELHEQVARLAVTDELTGLFNHRRFQEALATETERARRFGQTMALVMLDIDNFKKVNDNHGHQQGDLVLREVARVVRERSRDIDAPSRYGGEELAVVLPQTDLEGAEAFAERLREGIEALDLPLPEGGKLQVTASLGVSALPDTSDRPAGLIAAADAALYEAKRAGKNCVVRGRREAAARMTQSTDQVPG